MIQSFIAEYFGLATTPVATGSIVLGTAIACYRGFVGPKKRAALSSIIAPISEPVLRLIDTKSKPTFEQIVNTFVSAAQPMLGSFALVFTSFLISTLVIGAFIILAYGEKGKRLASLADFLRGGASAIDERSRALEEEVRRLETTIVQQLRAIGSANALLDDFEKSLPAAPDRTNQLLTMLIDTMLSVVFGRDKKFRAALYLKKDNNQHLEHYCSVNLQSLTTPDVFEKALPISTSVAGRTFETGQSFSYPNMKECKKPYAKPAIDKFSKSFVCVPISHDFRRWGVISIDCDEKQFPEIGESSLFFLNAVGYYLCYALSLAKPLGFTPIEIKNRG